MTEGPISAVVAALEELLARPDAQPEIVPLRESRDFWGSDWTPDEMAAVEDEFAGLYREAVAEVAAAWGPPEFAGSFGHPGFPPWCNGAEVSYWRREGRLACVWWAHEDKELPVALEVFVCPLDWPAPEAEPGAAPDTAV